MTANPSARGCSERKAGDYCMINKMSLLTRPRLGRLSFALLASLLMVGSPLLDGCGKPADAPPASTDAQASPSAAVLPARAAAPAGATAPPEAAPAAEMAPPGPPPAMASAEELQELVSPIALYPDVLVAQILAGSTYPTQVVEAARWVKENPNLTGDQLAAQVNPQPWDPSIKSLTQFPSVLQTMNESLAWTSALGEAYYNQPADVMNAIQTLRNRAINAGTLKDTPQQKIELQPAVATSSESGQGSSPQQTVIIQPAQPTTVYVPQYNPATVYGAPVQSPPGYTGTEMLTAGLLSFGVGMLVGSLINNNHNDWNCNWGGGSVHYNNNVYVSHTNVVPGRGYYPPAGYPRPPYGGAYPPGRYPSSGYPRPPAAGYPRPPAGAYPRPYPATRPAYNGAVPSTRPAYNGAVPATRPYDKAQAKQLAANNPNITKPNFPKPSTLPNNPSEANPNRKTPQNRPAQPARLPAQNGNRPGADWSATNRPAGNKPATGNFGNDPKRGYGGGNSRGGNAGALGGVQPGGLAQASSDRGQASMGGRNNRQSLGGGGGAGGGQSRGAVSGGGRGGGGSGGGGGGGGRKRR